jgi:two-component system OmpR family response regulator
MTNASGGAGTEPRRVAAVIEDDDDIRHLLETVLTQAGFQVIAASNGLDGIAAVKQYSPIVTTLDVNMPGMDGFETLRRIREFSETYVVMLTALGEEIDTLHGLESGADDYITKPFRPRELRARIEAMLRRPRSMVTDAAARPASPVSQFAPSVTPPPPLVPQPVEWESMEVTIPLALKRDYLAAAQAARMTTPVVQLAAHDADDGWLEHNGLWVNPQTRIVQQDGVEIELTRSEFDLLAGLMESTRRVRTKADLVLLLRGETYVTSHFVSDADKRAIEVHMANLRKKLSENPNAPRWIETVRGIGYRLTASDPT